MKTLDEVIENLSVKQSLKDLGHRPNPDEIADALYYLREYQEHMKWHAYEEHCLDNEKKTLQEKKAEFDDVLTDYVAMKQWWTEQQENPPLTWEELKGMEGKPVWVEAESLSVRVSPYWNDWYIIKSFSNDEFMYCNDGFEWAKEMQGRLWQAYRKERK